MIWVKKKNRGHCAKHKRCRNGYTGATSLFNVMLIVQLLLATVKGATNANCLKGEDFFPRLSLKINSKRLQLLRQPGFHFIIWYRGHKIKIRGPCIYSVHAKNSSSNTKDYSCDTINFAGHPLLDSSKILKGRLKYPSSIPSKVACCLQLQGKMLSLHTVNVRFECQAECSPGSPVRGSCLTLLNGRASPAASGTLCNGEPSKTGEPPLQCNNTLLKWYLLGIHWNRDVTWFK